MQDDKSMLTRAYSLETVADNIALYRDWAKTYERDFAEAMDYLAPKVTATELATRWNGEAPVLDIGAGTGLVGLHLEKAGVGPVDALDISAEMLEVAREKAVYRNLIVGDLTQTLPIEDGTYGVIISSGTLTHGHVGPEVLDECMRVAKSGALFALSANPTHWKNLGFDAKITSYGDAVRDVEIVMVPSYGPKANGDQTDDLSTLCFFYKT